MVKFPNAKILDIDLTKEVIDKYEISGDIYKNYPGGSCLGLYLLMKNLNPNINPLSPDNILVLSVSALTGLPISGLSRVVATTKSPLTGAIADSQAGGFFPVHLKSNGYDALVIRGKAKKPKYIYINGDNIQIIDASNVWGKVTGDSEKIIKKELNEDNVEIAQIGPGGENLVKYASIMNMCNRANGRNGTGAVMGSKNLKAIVVKKGKGQKPVDQIEFNKLSKNVIKRIKENPAIDVLGIHGTDGDLQPTNEEGFLPTRNWQSGYFGESAKKITGETMSETILKSRDTCYACAIRCKRVVEIKGVVDPLYGGPEYETCATFGSYCGIDDLQTISLANQLCNMYGIDTISCGATISFAMECYEKGLLTHTQTEKMELKFGNKDIIAELIKKISLREGIGDLLAEGSKIAASKIGKNANEFSISVKGQELPAHMPQAKPSFGLIYAVNPFGADHQSSEHDPFLLLPEDSEPINRMKKVTKWKKYEDQFALDSDKVEFAYNTQSYFSMLDTLCLCQFVWGPCWQLYGPNELLQLCSSGIGWETSIQELLEIGKRRINMMRYFNEKAGFTRLDDNLPKRIFKPFSDGPSKGICLDEATFEKAKDYYYEYAGWNIKTGNPKEETLENLGLKWIMNPKEEGVECNI